MPPSVTQKNEARIILIYLQIQLRFVTVNLYSPTSHLFNEFSIYATHVKGFPNKFHVFDTYIHFRPSPNVCDVFLLQCKIEMKSRRIFMPHNFYPNSRIPNVHATSSCYDILLTSRAHEFDIKLFRSKRIAPNHWRRMENGT